MRPEVMFLGVWNIIEWTSHGNCNTMPGPLSHSVVYASTTGGFGTTGSVFRIGTGYPIQIGFGWDNRFHWRGYYDSGWGDWQRMSLFSR